MRVPENDKHIFDMTYHVSWLIHSQRLPWYVLSACNWICIRTLLNKLNEYEWVSWLTRARHTTNSVAISFGQFVDPTRVACCNTVSRIVNLSPLSFVGQSSNHHRAGMRPMYICGVRLWPIGRILPLDPIWPWRQRITHSRTRDVLPPIWLIRRWADSLDEWSPMPLNFRRLPGWSTASLAVWESTNESSENNSQY